MKWYVADVIEHLLITACALTGHAGGCWLINSSPLRRLYWWAVNVRWNDDTAQHSACPLCRFDRNGYTETRQHRLQVARLENQIEALENMHSVTTVTAGGTASYRWDGETGRVERIA